MRAAGVANFPSTVVVPAGVDQLSVTTSAVSSAPPVAGHEEARSVVDAGEVLVRHLIGGDDIDLDPVDHDRLLPGVER